MAMASQISKDYPHLDILINNAGVLKTSKTRAASGRDIRFEVNTIAPYALTPYLATHPKHRPHHQSFLGSAGAHRL